MKITDLMSGTVLQDMLDRKYIRIQTHPDPLSDLKIYNYSELAMFAKEWNEATEQCRGLITTEDGTVVARPWRKFFNQGERPSLIGYQEPVQITDKMDGSLGIGYPSRSGLPYVATRGSFQSDQAIFATNWLQKHTASGELSWLPDWRFTPLWEIVYPENRIVLDYGDFEGLILLGCVGIDSGLYYGPYEAADLLHWESVTAYQFPHTTIYDFMMSGEAERRNAEGVVVRSGWKMIKIKQDDYVRAHAIVTGLSNRSVWESLSKGESLPEQASFMPDEFYQWLIKTAVELEDDKDHWASCALQEFNRIFESLPADATRGDFAYQATRSEYSAALFKIYDGKPFEDLAWKAVKPLRFERPFNQSQDSN